MNETNEAAEPQSGDAASRYEAPGGLPTPSEAPAKRKGRGPDLKPRKRSTRSDDPARYLPSGTEAHRIAKERGKTSGRRAGSRNGWTREEQAISWELANAKAKLEVAFLYEVGHMPTAEDRQRLYRAIDPAIVARHEAMMERRKQRAEQTVKQSRETLKP